MAKTIYYYRVNSKGLPLINSNNKVVGKFPKGRVVIYDPMFKICCDENITMPTFSNKKQRYFIKLDERNHPISNSLIMRSSKPKGNWQEVGPVCCTNKNVQRFVRYSTSFNLADIAYPSYYMYSLTNSSDPADYGRFMTIEDNLQFVKELTGAVDVQKLNDETMILHFNEDVSETEFTYYSAEYSTEFVGEINTYTVVITTTNSAIIT